MQVRYAEGLANHSDPESCAGIREGVTALLHHVDPDLLRLSFHALKRNAAPGADGVTWSDYEANLERNLQDLHSRVRRGAYRAQPSRRKS